LALFFVGLAKENRHSWQDVLHSWAGHH